MVYAWRARVTFPDFEEFIASLNAHRVSGSRSSVVASCASGVELDERCRWKHARCLSQRSRTGTPRPRSGRPRSAGAGFVRCSGGPLLPRPESGALEQRCATGDAGNADVPAWAPIGALRVSTLPWLAGFGGPSPCSRARRARGAPTPRSARRPRQCRRRRYRNRR